jgi:hypothetical protein
MNVNERILNAHVTKTLDEALLELSLYKDGKLVASGDGKLSVSADGRLQLEMDADTIPFNNSDPALRGAIIPDKEFCEIKATTRDNLTFKANKLFAETISSHIDKPAHAHFEPGQVTLLSPVSPQLYSSFDVFMAPFECDFFNRHCADGETNPVFGDNVSGQWLLVETAEIAIGLRKESDL